MQNPYRDEDERPTPTGMGDLLKKVPLARKPVRGIHSEEHELAKQLTEYFHEPKKFGMWLGIIKKHGTQKVYQAFAEVKQSNARRPVMLLMWKLSAKANARPKEPGGGDAVRS